MREREKGPFFFLSLCRRWRLMVEIGQMWKRKSPAACRRDSLPEKRGEKSIKKGPWKCQMITVQFNSREERIVCVNVTTMMWCDWPPVMLLWMCVQYEYHIHNSDNVIRQFRLIRHDTRYMLSLLSCFYDDDDSLPTWKSQKGNCANTCDNDKSESFSVC